MKKRDALWAGAVIVAALAVYLPTLYPGLGGGGDSAKFQYLGRVLGTAHPPGYPLYVFASYLFGLLPLGTLAYRINVMSACCSAIAAGLVYLMLVRLRGHRGVAVVAALGLAFGRFFWERSLVAEVYPLNALLVALVLFLAIRWADTGRDVDLYLTMAAFAIGLGNHLTIAMLAPGLLLYVWLVRPAAINARNVVAGALILVVGLTQYLFVMLRTWQQAPFVEARASNLRELFDVMRAARYADQEFAFSAAEFVTERLPRFWGVLRAELGLAGVVALATGLAIVAVKRRPAGILAAAGAAGLVFLTLNVGADVEGFLVAAFVPMWVLAGLGMDAVWSWASRAGRAAGGVVLAASAVMPVWALWHNWSYNDHHRRTFETRFMHEVFDRLDAKSAIVTEAYSVDQLVHYMLVGEKAARGRSIVVAPNDPVTLERLRADGYAIFAFDASAASLENQGLAFESVPIAIVDGGITLHRLVAAAPCADVGNAGWQEVSRVAATGELVWRLDNYRPFEARVVMYVMSPATPRASGREAAVVIAQGPARPAIQSTRFRTAVAVERIQLEAALERDGLPNPQVLLSSPGVVSRVELRVDDAGQSSVSVVTLGARPSVVWTRATVDLDNPKRARVCGWVRPPLLDIRTADRIPVGADGSAFFGQGWEAPEPFGGQVARRMSGFEAEILVPLAKAARIRVAIDVLATSAPSVELLVNGALVGAQRLSNAWTTYEWEVPASAWIPGFNRLVLRRLGASGPPDTGPGPEVWLAALSFQTGVTLAPPGPGGHYAEPSAHRLDRLPVVRLGRRPARAEAEVHGQGNVLPNGIDREPRDLARRRDRGVLAELRRPHTRSDAIEPVGHQRLGRPAAPAHRRPLE